MTQLPLQVRDEKNRLAAEAWRRALTEDLPLAAFGPTTRTLGLSSLSFSLGIRGMALTYHARVLGKTDDAVDAFFVKALAALCHRVLC